MTVEVSDHPGVSDQIRYLAYRLSNQPRFRADERDDIRQDLWLKVLEKLPEFNPRRGKLFTFAMIVITRNSRNLIRHRRAAKRNSGPVASLNGKRDDDCEELGDTLTDRAHEFRTGKHGRDTSELLQLATDTETVLSQLPPHLRALAERLKHSPKTSVAKEMNISRATLQDWMIELRKWFTHTGLDGYM